MHRMRSYRQLDPTASRISLLLHASEAELRMSVNNKGPMSVVGFNWLLLQSFDLSCFYQKNCWNLCKYVLSQQLDVWNVYWAINSYCLGNNYVPYTPSFQL